MPCYAEVSSGGNGCYLRGWLHFSGVSSRKLSWKVVGLDMFVICSVVGVLVGFFTGC